MPRRLDPTRSTLASAVILVTLAQVAPAAAQQSDENQAKRRVWVASFVEGMRDDPKRFAEYYRALQNPDLASWKKTAATILVDAPREVSNNVGFETLYNAVRIHHKYPHEKDDEYLAEVLLDEPEVTYSLAETAFRLLTTPKSELNSVERGWQKATKAAVADGTIPSANQSFSQLVAQAPGGAVANVLNDQQVQVAAADRQGLKVVLERRFGSLDGAQAAVLKSISDNQKQIDRLTGEIQKVRGDLTAQAKREALAKERANLIAETRSGLYIASTLLSFVDPEAGRFVSVAGSAAIDASVAVASLMGTFSFAATGNLLGAGIQIATLFGNKGGGAEAQRHAQIVNMLKAIRQQLIDLQKDLKIVNTKLDRALLELEFVQNGQVLQTTSLINHLNDLQRSIGSSFARVVEVGRDASRGEHIIRHKSCLASFPFGRIQIRKEKTDDGRRLTSCLAAYHAFGSDIARNSTWTLNSFDWEKGNRAELNFPTPLSYTGVVPAIAKDLAQASGKAPPVKALAVGTIGNPEAIAVAVNAVIDLRMRQSALQFMQEEDQLRLMQEDLKTFKSAAEEALFLSRGENSLGLAAFEASKAEIQKIVLEAEATMLKQQALDGAHGSLITVCAMQLKQAVDSADVKNCSNTLPKLSDRILQKSANDLLRYAVHFGNLKISSDDWSYEGPKDPTYHQRSWSAWRYDATFCVTYEPKITNIYIFNRVRHCEWFDEKRYAARPAERDRVINLRDTRLNEMVAGLRSAPMTWSPPQDQAWYSNALGVTEKILEPKRRAFAIAVAGKLNTNATEVSALNVALRRLDRIRDAWRSYEQLALGGCYDVTSSNFEVLAYAQMIPKSGDLIAALASGELHDFMRATDPIPAGTKVSLPLMTGGTIGLCNPVPAYVDGAISDIDRYIALAILRREVAQGRRKIF